MDHIAKIFMTGRSQAIRLPKELQFNCSEVHVRKQGESFVISPKQISWDEFFDQKPAFDDTFLDNRE